MLQATVLAFCVLANGNKIDIIVARFVARNAQARPHIGIQSKLFPQRQVQGLVAFPNGSGHGPLEANPTLPHRLHTVPSDEASCLGIHCLAYKVYIPFYLNFHGIENLHPRSPHSGFQHVHRNPCHDTTYTVENRALLRNNVSGMPPRKMFLWTFTPAELKDHKFFRLILNCMAWLGGSQSRIRKVSVNSLNSKVCPYSVALHPYHLGCVTSCSIFSLQISSCNFHHPNYWWNGFQRVCWKLDFNVFVENVEWQTLRVTSHRPFQLGDSLMSPNSMKWFSNKCWLLLMWVSQLEEQPYYVTTPYITAKVITTF